MKLSYFKIKEAFNDARDSFSYGSTSEKLASTAKLLGKSVANIGMLAVEVGGEAIRPENLGKVINEHLDKNSNNMSQDQIKRANKIIDKGNEARKRRL